MQHKVFFIGNLVSPVYDNLCILWGKWENKRILQFNQSFATMRHVLKLWFSTNITQEVFFLNIFTYDIIYLFYQYRKSTFFTTWINKIYIIYGSNQNIQYHDQQYKYVLFFKHVSKLSECQSYKLLL